ncbi:MAG: prepilin peptidase [Zetaproteobacteria bacterium CG_4_9_14_3_um_filter_49_83]|nr:MAG: prepilin peptidase [Zetaproteobacteria bacterium CG17_big_fil_post_rev_8_21_14_2_50_50_13]PIV29204.1 MAG: prepilin peptidase [Zetaproteobacteria bacterium CG02_land_8_20_14_3_00_50_9]PIY55998.1 MAG: prepilin peptidase [Zetaproteobacteria bacterium CG_4_10_14_0_8_um_filter_49_80]PJA36326.1 MAG: prepilin peptidase [Zetaproteobacteria bacterium CG_4_9_14_3_um_filter_49_83]
MMNETEFLIVLSGIVGLMMGSFFNVCVHRIPRRESIVTPGSHCPSCNHAIAWYDNIPLVSWSILKGQCRHCAQPISFRYPVLEAVVGLSWAGLAMHFGLSVMLLQALFLVSFLWILSLIDLETGLLPDVLTYPGMVAGLLFSAYFGHLQDGVIGCVAGYAFFWLVNKGYWLVTRQEGLGHGDFKLLAMLGAFMGWQALPFIVFASSVIGAVLGGAWLWLNKQQRQSHIPYGPFLALAGMVWFVWHEQILYNYLHAVGVNLQ